eukprot:CAMPEP_0119325776 /NCGR_PEP_ID=MMETSP1333-20130426/66683_1 /TAXON_ID=418940 /ORGANISM="Scyphosphaera apsteinii, Strain RCC1455" /LENGTH=250 /DNA_ID=CAMNT_0007333865 /DNA_START=84 /DNA_END=836 /DNA_ORIENTATION=-
MNSSFSSVFDTGCGCYTDGHAVGSVKRRYCAGDCSHKACRAVGVVADFSEQMLRSLEVTGATTVGLHRSNIVKQAVSILKEKCHIPVIKNHLIRNVKDNGTSAKLYINPTLLLCQSLSLANGVHVMRQTGMRHIFDYETFQIDGVGALRMLLKLVDASGVNVAALQNSRMRKTLPDQLGQLLVNLEEIQQEFGEYPCLREMLDDTKSKSHASCKLNSSQAHVLARCNHMLEAYGSTNLSTSNGTTRCSIG